MVRNIKNKPDKNTPIEIVHRIIDNNMRTKYNVEREEINENDTERATITENKSAENIKLIDKFTATKKTNQEQKQTEDGEQKIKDVLEEYKAKSRITNMQIIKKNNQTPIKQILSGNIKRRRISSDSDREDGEKEKDFSHDESGQSPLAGIMKTEDKPASS